MAQFTKDFRGLRRFDRFQVLSMLTLSGYNGRKMSKEESLQWLETFAGRGYDENQRVWSAYHSTKNRRAGNYDEDGKEVGAEAVNISELRTELVTYIDNNIPDPVETIKSAALTKAFKDVDKIMEDIKKSAMAEAKQVQKKEIHVKSDSKTKKLKGMLPEEFEQILQLASQRVNVAMVGPAGCGKTFLGSKVAEALGLKFASVSCSLGMSESQLSGWLLPTGKNGTFEYKASPFVDCYENGGVFLFDEADSADPNTLTFINSAIANEQFNLPQRLNNPVVKKHKDFVCMAALNTFGNGADMVYVGRNQLDGATLDRFRAGMVVMDYSKQVEEALIDSAVLEWGLKIRESIRVHGLNRILSTRVMLEFTKMKSAYDWDLQKFNEVYFADWETDEKRRVLS